MRKKAAGILVCQIEDSCLRIAGFSRRRSRSRPLCLLAEEQLPLRAGDNETVRDIESAVQKRMDGLPERLVISLPRSRITWKHLEIPSSSLREIEHAGRLHAGRLMFLPQNEVIAVCETITLQRRGRALVSLMAASRADIEKYYRFFSFVDPYNIYFRLSSQGTACLFREACGERPGMSLVLASYSRCWEADLIKDGRLVYARSFNVPREGNYLSIISAETRAVLEYYSREVENSRISCVYLLPPPEQGDGKEILRGLSRFMGMQVVPFPYDKAVSSFCSAACAGKDARSFLPLIGLSLQAGREGKACSGDFSLPEVKSGRSAERLKRSAAVFISVIALLNLAVSVYFHFLASAELERLRALSLPLERMEKAAASLLDAGKRAFFLRERARARQESLSGVLFYIGGAAGKNNVILDKLVYERNKRIFLQGRQNGWDSLKGFVSGVTSGTVLRSWREGRLEMNRAALNGIRGENVLFKAEWVK